MFVDFAISVAKGIADMNQREAPERVTEADMADKLKGRHFLESIEKGIKKTRNCHVCYQKAVKANVPAAERRKHRKVTSYRCKTCKVPFCLEPFYELRVDTTTTLKVLEMKNIKMKPNCLDLFGI